MQPSPSQPHLTPYIHSQPRLQVYRAFWQAFTAPNTPFGASNVSMSGGKEQSMFVEEDWGAFVWVHPMRWRQVLSGPLTAVFDNDTNKALVKKVRRRPMVVVVSCSSHPPRRKHTPNHLVPCCTAQVSELKPEQARSKAYYGCIDLDTIMRYVMEAW